MASAQDSENRNDTEQRYEARMRRYTTALRNEQPDMIPIRPFVAEFTARYAGYTCQQVAHDYELAFEAARRCAADFDWDAVVANMVYVWTGLTQAIGLKYYAIPGIHISRDTGFQYREPEEEHAFMKPDEYDQLIEDPTGYLYNVWLPRVSEAVCPIGEPSTYDNNLSFVKGAMAMLSYFNGFGVQAQKLREESGTVSAIAGILKAPLDIIADKLRGYLGLLTDLQTQPTKVLAACEALAPHLFNVALSGADPARQVPAGLWMHRGGVPFVGPKVFEEIYWTTLKPIVLELWAHGVQTMFYAEGSWDYHLNSFAELPDRSIIYHVDQGDIHRVHEVLGDKFCLSGGIPNSILSFGTEQEVRDKCKEVIDGVAADGGYIMDASAIMQDDTKTENLRALTDFTREYGVYSRSASTVEPPPADKLAPLGDERFAGMTRSTVRPGACVPWETKAQQIGEIQGDAEIVRDVWERIDALGNMYIWQILLSF
jgi:uroporphyrinogen-III decarboxylase